MLLMEPKDILVFVTNSIKGMFRIHQHDNHQSATRSVNGFISQVLTYLLTYYMVQSP